jgi:hypothetical protein
MQERPLLARALLRHQTLLVMVTSLGATELPHLTIHLNTKPQQLLNFNAQ